MKLTELARRNKHFSFSAFGIFVAMLCVSFSVFSQQDISFAQLSVNNGLSQNSAVSVSQDQDGFLWIATQDGLNRYDGKEFKIYKKKFVDITQGNHLQLGKVFADSKNRIWIIPDSSIPELLDKATDKFQATGGVESASCIYEDSLGNVWVGSFLGQLFKWNEKTQSFEEFWNDPTREIKDIETYEKESLLITFKDGVALFNTKTLGITLFDLPSHQTFYSSCKVDHKGNIWVGSLNKGIWVISSGKLVGKPASALFETSKYPLDSKMIIDITIDSRQNIWFGTYGRGAIVFNWKDQIFSHFGYTKQNPRSIHYNDILCIYEDYSGTIWFGTDGGGLSFYDRYLEKFNFFHNEQVPENINIDVVRSIYVDENDHIWIGTSGKGLTEFNPSTKAWKTYTFNGSLHKKFIAGNRILSIMGDGNGKLWVGYQDEGLSILDLRSRTFTHFNVNSNISPPAKTIQKIFKDVEGRFWLATRNSGLIQFSPQKGILRQYKYNPDNPLSIPENNIRTIEQSKDGLLWIGTETHGIASFNPDTDEFISFKHNSENPNSLSSNKIKSICIGNNNILWIGTNGAGLNAMNLSTMEFTHISTEDGLANDVIYGILPDDEGNLWLSSNMGIAKLSFSDSLDFTITNFTNYAGLASEFNTGAYYRHNNGTKYFGSLEGIYWFRNEDIVLNDIAPKTAITELFVFNEPISTNSAPILKHNQNTITINMASLVFSSPNKNEFQYMLVNHDQDWVYAGTNHQARYTKLRPGEYTFLAKSSNYDGTWSDEPVSLSFTITPPWFKTDWAYIVYVMMFIMSIYSLYRYLKWYWFMQVKLRLKENEAARLKEVNDFKSKLFTNISHELRTPLTLISGPAERLLTQSGNPLQKSQLNLIKHNANRLLNLVDQLMEVSRLKSGKQKLNVNKGNLGLLIQTIVVNHFTIAIEKNISIKTHIPLITEVWYDADKMEIIVNNLISNAIKYGKPDTEIYLECKVSEGILLLTVTNESDTKFDEADSEYLMERFFQKNNTSDGFGIGLSFVHELVKICHGDIEIDFSKNGVFQVIVKVQINNSAFHSNQLEKEKVNDDFLIEQDSNALKAKNDAPIVLITEDNNEFRKFFIAVLNPFYRILEAKNGREGLTLAFENIPDLILSDIMMPEMDGVEMCNQLKTDEKTSHIPIILLTAKSSEEDVLAGLKAGADDYFSKPVSSAKLLLRIEKLIDLRMKLRNHYGTKARISPKELTLTSIDEKFLTKVKEVVDKDFCDSSFSVEDFAQKLSMSRMQLHRKLTALTGLSATSFIRGQRLQMAMDRLEENTGSIAEIAYEVGFSSPSYFIKSFKECYKMTPSEYKKIKQNSAID